MVLGLVQVGKQHMVLGLVQVGKQGMVGGLTEIIVNTGFLVTLELDVFSMKYDED